MKLVVAVIQAEDATQTVRALSTAGISLTRLSSSGGFLGQNNATLLIGVDDERVDHVMRMIRDNCRERSQYLTPLFPVGEIEGMFLPFPAEISVGGATVFVVPIERFEQL